MRKCNLTWDEVQYGWDLMSFRLVAVYQVACASPSTIRTLFFGGVDGDEASAAAVSSVKDDAPNGPDEQASVHSPGSLLTPLVAYLLTSRLEQLEPGGGSEATGGQCQEEAGEGAGDAAGGSLPAGNQGGPQDTELPIRGERRGSGRPSCCSSEGTGEQHLPDAALISLLYPALYGATGNPDKVTSWGTWASVLCC